MAKKKTTANKIIKQGKKMAKKNPKGFAILIVVLIVLIALGVGGYFAYTYFFPKVEFKLNGNKETSVALNSTYKEKGATATYNGKDISENIVITYYLNDIKKETIKTDEEVTYTVKYNLDYQRYQGELTRKVKVTTVEEIDINFLELGNRYTGDCTFIKAGDTDILIDAGSRQSSAETIDNFVKSYCDDGVLEYVIATHAHQDHIEGFTSTNSNKGIFDRYKIDTLIDFALTNNEGKALYTKYAQLRDAKVASGDITHHYTAADCISGKNGASKTYELAAGITMEILDQKFYHEKGSDENDYSVCALFTQGDNHYLFTGDLEEKGETSLVELNNLPEVQLFKGGHHGSYTANTDTLLSVIKPKTVCICCCAGSKEYTDNKDNMFPAQRAIERIGKYTDKVYVTTLMIDYDKNQYESMNGNINFHCSKGVEYTVTGSNNSVILKETVWFKKNRTWPN